MSIPTARTPSFTGRAASAATTRKARSKMRNEPLKSARRRACGRHRQASGLPTRPTGEQKQKKRTDDGLPKPDNFIRYRHELRRPPVNVDATPSGLVMDLLQSVDRGWDALEARLQLQRQELRIMARLMQIAAVQP